MANTHVAYSDLAIDKFSGTDLDQDAESFIQLIERKITFALEDAPADAGELENYTFRRKALFSSLLQGPPAEWYESNITNATSCENVRTNIITRFSDGQNKFPYRMEVEHCIRGDGEDIRNFLHRIKRTVDKGWPDDLNGIEAAHHAAERAAQGRQRRQKYIDYSLKGLRPRYLQRKAQDYLMENQNATWNDFSTRIIQRCIIPSFFQLFKWRRTNQGSDGHFGPRDEESTIGTTRTSSQCCRRKFSNSRPKPKGKTECNTVLQLLPHKQTYPELVPREDTGRRIKTHWKRKNWWEKSHVYSGLQQKTRTRSWIRAMD